MNILSLGEKIKKLRKDKGMTLKELAGDRITAAQISHIERDKSHTSYELLEYLSQELDVNIDYLIESKEMQARNLAEHYILQSEVFIKYNDFELAEDRLTTAINLSKEYKLYDIFGNCNYLFGDIHLNKKNYNDAISSYEKALHLFIKSNDGLSIFETYNNIGKIYINQKNYESSIIKLELASEVINNMDFEKTISQYKELYSNMAYCYNKLDDLEKCVEYISKIDNINDMYSSKEELESNLLKANNLFALGKLEDSKLYFKKVLKFLDKSNSDIQIVDIYLTILDICKEIEDSDRMLEYSQKIYDMKKDSFDDYAIKSIHCMIESYIMKKDYEEAKKYCKLSLKMCIKNKDKYNEFMILKLYSKIHKELNENDLSEKYLISCLNVAREIDNKKLVGDVYIELAEIYSSTCQNKQLEFYQKGLSIYKSLETV